MNQGRNFLWCQDTDIRKNQIKTIFFLALFYNGEIEFFFFFTEHIEFKISYQKITFFVDFKNRLCDFVRLSFFLFILFYNQFYNIQKDLKHFFFAVCYDWGDDNFQTDQKETQKVHYVSSDCVLGVFEG